MPRRERDNYKRWLANAIQHNRYSMRYLRRLQAIFLPHHHDLAAFVDMLLALKREEQKQLLALWRHAWGPSFARWHKWHTVKDTRKKIRKG